MFSHLTNAGPIQFHLYLTIFDQKGEGQIDTKGAQREWSEVAISWGVETKRKSLNEAATAHAESSRQLGVTECFQTAHYEKVGRMKLLLTRNYAAVRRS